MREYFGVGQEKQMELPFENSLKRSPVSIGDWDNWLTSSIEEQKPMGVSVDMIKEKLVKKWSEELAKSKTRQTGMTELTNGYLKLDGEDKTSIDAPGDIVINAGDVRIENCTMNAGGNVIIQCEKGTIKNCTIPGGILMVSDKGVQVKTKEPIRLLETEANIAKCTSVKEPCYWAIGDEEVIMLGNGRRVVLPWPEEGKRRRIVVKNDDGVGGVVSCVDSVNGKMEYEVGSFEHLEFVSDGKNWECDKNGRVWLKMEPKIDYKGLRIDFAPHVEDAKVWMNGRMVRAIQNVRVVVHAGGEASVVIEMLEGSDWDAKLFDGMKNVRIVRKRIEGVEDGWTSPEPLGNADKMIQHGGLRVDIGANAGETTIWVGDKAIGHCQSLEMQLGVNSEFRATLGFSQGKVGNTWKDREGYVEWLMGLGMGGVGIKRVEGNDKWIDEIGTDGHIDSVEDDRWKALEWELGGEILEDRPHPYQSYLSVKAFIQKQPVGLRKEWAAKPSFGSFRWSDEWCLLALAQDEAASVRELVARNEKTPAEIWRLLANDEDAMIRSAVYNRLAAEYGGPGEPADDVAEKWEITDSKDGEEAWRKGMISLDEMHYGIQEPAQSTADWRTDKAKIEPTGEDLKAWKDVFGGKGIEIRTYPGETISETKQEPDTKWSSIALMAAGCVAGGLVSKMMSGSDVRVKTSDDVADNVVELTNSMTK